jgi:beta-glucosidase
VRESSRREFLAGAAALAASLPLAGCRGTPGVASPSVSAPPSAGASPLPGPPASTASSTRALPADLLLGVGTSAYQIEGGAYADGRGPSIWDTFSAQPGTIDDGSSGAVACDHYHRWKADVDLMAELGVQSYRFSISWPRIFPSGRGKVNAAGVNFYRRLVDRLHDRGIKALATLFHWDYPQALQDDGGWENRDSASWFADYAETVFDKLDGVDRWVTINEPKIIVQQSYQRGALPPGKRDNRAAGRVLHHLALAHGRAVQAFRASDQTGEIGPCIVVNPFFPADDSAAAAEQVQQADAWANTVYLDPVLRGRYPALVSSFDPEVQVGLQGAIRDKDLATISTQVDFVGVNYYTPGIVDRNGKYLDYYPKSSAGWQQIYADGLYRFAVRAHRDYAIPLIITETGLPDDPDAKPGHDPYRISYFADHLDAVRRAIADGVSIKGFHAWSLLDNFEWVRGYTQRWGLVRVDFETQRRTPKDSARWYAKVIDQRSLSPR